MIRLERQHSQNLRNRLPPGYVQIRREGGLEVVETEDGGKARTLVAAYGFLVAHAPPPAPEPVPDAQPPAAPQPPQAAPGPANAPQPGQPAQEAASGQPAAEPAQRPTRKRR